MWLTAIKPGNYASWTGLTYNNDTKFCTYTDKTIKGHLNLVHQGMCSTNTKQATPTPVPSPSLTLTDVSSKDILLWEVPIIKL